MVARQNLLVLALLASLLCVALSSAAAATIESWLTTADLRETISPQPSLAFTAATDATDNRIEIEDTKTFQTILGLGSSLEPTTCSNFWRMAPADRETLMERVVDPDKGIGMNLMRLCIGTPDFTGDPWHSCDDVAPGETDPELVRFSITKDRDYILPVLKLARGLKPDLLFFASPWSPPAWMKTNQSLIGGSLDRKWYGAYTRYFVKFIQAYESEGIPLYAVTIQNEPGVDRSKQSVRWHYPSCHYTAEQERDLIRDHLGPAFSAAGLKTKIWSYDHNFNEKAGSDDPGIDYPTVVMTDAPAGRYVGGIAFHGYEGHPSGMSTFHTRFPAVPLHFSEGSVFGSRGATELISILRNWASSYNAWVTMIDENRGPNNGPFKPSRTMVTLDGKTGGVKYHNDFFFYTQFMRFVKRGAVRLESSGVPENVAFQNRDGQIVLIVANAEAKEAKIRVEFGGSAFVTVLPRQSVGTYTWPR